MKKITTSLVLLALSGSSLRAEAFRKVQEEVSERTGVDVRWAKEMASREQTSALVQKLLKKPLTVSSAVQIALLNNRGLQVTFEEVGIAQADVIEAVTLPNPWWISRFSSPSLLERSIATRGWSLRSLFRSL